MRKGADGRQRSSTSGKAFWTFRQWNAFNAMGKIQISFTKFSYQKLYPIWPFFFWQKDKRGAWLARCLFSSFITAQAKTGLYSLLLLLLTSPQLDSHHSDFCWTSNCNRRCLRTIFGWKFFFFFFQVFVWCRTNRVRVFYMRSQRAVRRPDVDVNEYTADSIGTR